MLQLLLSDAREGEGFTEVLEGLGCWRGLGSAGVLSSPFFFRVGAVLLLLAMSWGPLVMLPEP